MATVYTEFLRILKPGDLLPPGAGVLAAVSGGADSTALFDLLARFKDRMGWRIVVGHVNYQKRGADSEADERAVREMAGRWELPILVDREFPLEPDGGNFQDQARVYRYRLFREWAIQENLSIICTAHHRDDQVETILHRLLRGAGPSGLSGMPKRRTMSSSPPIALVRPLLSFSKKALMAYLTDRGIPFREDASNASRHYLRNRIRHDLIPLLCELAPRAEDRLLELGDLFRGMDSLVKKEVNRFVDQHVKSSPDCLFLFPRQAFLDLHPAIRSAVLHHLFTRHFDGVLIPRKTIELLVNLIVKNAGGYEYALPLGHFFRKDAHSVWVNRI